VICSNFACGKDVYDWSISGDDVTSPELNPPTHVYIGDRRDGPFNIVSVRLFHILIIWIILVKRLLNGHLDSP
jgi:hypothetical protein